MGFCPNINHPGYQALVKTHGEIEAYNLWYEANNQLLEDDMNAIAPYMPEAFESEEDFSKLGITKRKANDYYTINPTVDFEGKEDILNMSGIQKGKYGYYYVLNDDDQKAMKAYQSKHKNAKVGSSDKGFKISGNINRDIYIKKVRGKNFLYIDLKHLVKDEDVYLPKIYGKIKVPVTLVNNNELTTYRESFNKEVEYIPEQEAEIRRYLYKTKGVSTGRAANFYLFNVKDIIIDVINRFGGKVKYQDLSNMSEDAVERIKEELDIDSKIQAIKDEYNHLAETVDENELRNQIIATVQDEYDAETVEGIWSLLNYLPESFLRLLSVEFVQTETAFFHSEDDRNKDSAIPSINGLGYIKNLIPAMATNVALRNMLDDGIITKEHVDKLNEDFRKGIEEYIKLRNLYAKDKKVIPYDEIRSSVRKWKFMDKQPPLKRDGQVVPFINVFFDYHKNAIDKITEQSVRQNKGLTDVVSFITKLKNTKLNKTFTNITLGKLESIKDFPVDYTVVAAHELGHALDFYLHSTKPDIVDKVSLFLAFIESSSEYQTYIKEGLESRGYDINYRKEIAADFYAWVMAKNAGYDVSKSHIKSFDDFMKKNEFFVEEKFKQAFDIRTAEKIDPSTNAPSTILDFFKELFKGLIDWVNSFLGTNHYSLENNEIKERESHGESIAAMLKYLDRQLFSDSTFDIDAILDSNTQANFSRGLLTPEASYRQVESLASRMGISRPVTLKYEDRNTDTDKQVREKQYRELLNKLATKFKIDWVEDNEQADIGRYQGGKVYINFNKIEADTVFHEFLHPFEQAVKKQNPILWKSLASRAMKVTKDGINVFDHVKQNYPELNEEDQMSEAIVTAMGLYAADSQGLVGGEQFGIMALNFLRKILKMFQDLFNSKTIDIKDDRLLYMSFKQLTDILFKSNATIEYGNLAGGKTWFQKPEETFSILKALQNDLTIDKASHKYSYKGKSVKASVHEAVVDPYYKEQFGDKPVKTEIKLRNEALAELGDDFHEVMQEIENRYTDPATGLPRATPLPTKLGGYVYESMENYFKALMEFHKDKNPRYMSEVRLYNAKADMAGTADLVVITDDGIFVYDWKSIQTSYHGSKIDDIQFYKEHAYRLQLGEYKVMLEQLTGNKVVYAAAIPMEANATITIANKQVVSKALRQFNIGNFDPRLIDADKDYLLPVVLKDQETGDELLDKYIQRINGIVDKLTELSTKGDVEKRENKIKTLNTLRTVIRNLQVKLNVKNFKEAAILYIREVNRNLKKSNDEINKSELYDALGILEVFRESSSFLRNIIKSADDIESLDISKNPNYQDVLFITDAAGNLITDVKKRIEEVTVHTGNAYGVENLLSPQRGLDAIKRTFRSISTMPIKTVELLWNMLKHKMTIRDNKTFAYTKSLREVEDNLKKWASANGMSIHDAIDKLYDHEDGVNNGKFLSKYTQEFKDLKKKAIAEDNIQWLQDNTTFDKAAFDKYMEKQEEYINNTEYSTDFKKNIEKRQQNIFKLYRQYMVYITLEDGSQHVNHEAITNPRNRFLVPKDKYISKEWKYLQDSKNAPLKAAYDKFHEIINYAKSKEVGMFEDDYMNRFIPNIEANRVERMFVNGAVELVSLKPFLNAIDAKNVDQSFMKLDPVRGQEMKTIPVYFTNDLIERDENGKIKNTIRKSKDLFKVFAIFSAHVYDYEMKAKMEDDANLLLEVEKNKTTYQTNILNHAKRDKFGNLKVIPGKGEASPVYKVLEDYVNYYIYNQVDNSDYVFKGPKGKDISARKVLNHALGFMSLKTLSFNVPSATANLFGGKMNAYFEASKKINFTEADWRDASYNLTRADQKSWAMIDYLNVFLEDMRQEEATKLSVFTSNKIFNTNNAMVLQRGTDKLVQHPVALAMTYTHMLDDNGKIVSIKKYVKAKNNYEGSYDRLSLAEKKALDAKIQKEVEELQKTKSLFKIAQFKDGKISIPGIDVNSQDFANFRYKVKKVNKGILGNSTKDDITRARLTMLGQAYMQFRNWMPQMVTERFGDYAYDPDLERFTYGKTRMFIKEMVSKNVLKLTKDLIFGFGTNTIQAAKARYATIEKQYQLTGETLPISETEFIDLYISNLRSQMRELMVILSGVVLLFAAFTGGDDDDKGWKKMVRRTSKRLVNELGFYYSPNNFTSLVKSPFPIVKLVQDVQNFVLDLGQEGIGQVIGSEELKKGAQPTKYFFNILPITKEALIWGATLDEDFRKEFDIKIVN